MSSSKKEAMTNPMMRHSPPVFRSGTVGDSSLWHITPPSSSITGIFTFHTGESLSPPESAESKYGGVYRGGDPCSRGRPKTDSGMPSPLRIELHTPHVVRRESGSPHPFG